MSQKAQVWIFFAVVFAWTWGFAAVLVAAPQWTEATFGEMSATHPIFVAAVFGPSLWGVVLTGWFEGRAGLVALARRLRPLRTSPLWLLVVPAALLLLAFAGGWVASLFGWASAPSFAGWSALGLALTWMFIQEPGPIGEELGWRGFALPRMLETQSPRTASLVLGAVWAIWHLPAFFISGTPQQALTLPLFLVGAVGLSVLATWLFTRTAGSVLVSIVFHRMANSANDLAGTTFEVFCVAVAVVAVAVLVRRDFGKRLLRPI